MRPLVVVDLESIMDPVAGRLVVASAHARIDLHRPLRVAGPHDAADSMEGAAGVFVTGSPVMLADVDWAAPLASALEDTASRGVPVLGVCFAHQMLARHFGATLASFEAVRVGVPKVRFDAAGPFSSETLPLIHTHRDHVTTVPPCMDAVAEGGLGGIPALAHRTLPLWTLQGHPEWTPALCRHEGAAWQRFTDAELATPAATGILRRFGEGLAKE